MKNEEGGEEEGEGENLVQRRGRVKELEHLESGSSEKKSGNLKTKKLWQP